jgi:peptidoglycan hydrolase CwlO-like protein
MDGKDYAGFRVRTKRRNQKMNQTEQHLKRIQDKLQHLLKNFSAVEKENARLKDELNKRKELSVRYHQKIDELKQQVNILKLGNGEMNESDKKNFEKQINTYLKEIDKCIALLSK